MTLAQEPRPILSDLVELARAEKPLRERCCPSCVKGILTDFILESSSEPEDSQNFQNLNFLIIFFLFVAFLQKVYPI